MFCTVCKNAGKSEKDFTSHFVKESTSPFAKVVCPTLLQQQCNYCKEKGHTPKFCPKLKERHEKKKAAASRTPFCSVCRDAGQPESEYTSHFVKDQPGPDGIVVCPLLLSQKCRYCKEYGHTPSQCHKLQLKKMQHGLIQQTTYYTNSLVLWDCFTKQNQVVLHTKNTSSSNKCVHPRPRLQVPTVNFTSPKPIEDIHYEKRNKVNTHLPDNIITPLEQQEAHKIIIQVQKNNAKKKTDLANFKGIGNGPIKFAKVNDIFTYYDWKRTNPNDRYITDIDYRFIHQDGSQRKMSWEEWCDKNYQDQYKIRIMNAKSASTHKNCEEKIHNRMFAQTLYTKTEEDNAMKEADLEFQYLEDLERMQLCFMPKLRRAVALGVTI